MVKLFGTDGIRGVANADLTPELAFQVGRAAASLLLRGRTGAVLVGRDTRLSGSMLEASLVAAICSVGGDVGRLGVLPTPGVAYLTRKWGAPFGVVISASHNPVEDNGIKFFDQDGFKLPDRLEEEIETLVASPQDLPRATGTAIGRAWDLPQGEEEYLSYLLAHARGRVEGWRIVVDCAFGASYRIAPRLWEALGAKVIALHDEPDGARINVACGSTHPEVLQRAVREYGAHLGFSHDGDADRVIAVDERGEIVDGDSILGICALHFHAAGRLPGRRVVATVMSNLGLERALARAGIILERTRVGDRYVLEKMLELNVPLGGEQSGHIIFLEHATTGDGLLTAIQLVNVMLETGKRLSELASPIERFPQVLRSVRVMSRSEVAGDGEIQEAVRSFASALAGQGRILVRPSGTEPVVRVMVECGRKEEAEAIASELVALIQRKYGVEGAEGGR
mgnify:FL=1